MLKKYKKIPIRKTTPKSKTKPKKEINLNKLRVIAEKGHNDTQTALLMDVSLATFKKWKKMPDVSKVLKDGRQKAIDNKLISSHKDPGGVETEYKPKYCKAIINFFKPVYEDPYTYQAKMSVDKKGKVQEEHTKEIANVPLMQDFAISIGYCVDTLNEWKKNIAKFSEAYSIAKDMQKSIMIKNGLNGFYKSNYINLVSKDLLGMRENVDLTTDGEKLPGAEVRIYNIPAFSKEDG